jgi:hypothetical protein
VLPAETQAWAPVLELADGHAHGGIALAPQRNLDRVVHADDLRGDDLRAAWPAARGQERRFMAHEDQFSLGMRGQESPAGRQRDHGTVVTSHAVDGDAHRRQGCEIEVSEHGG